MDRHLRLVLSALAVSVVGCSSAGGGGGGIPCSDAGLCENNLVCVQGVCVTPEGGAGTGGAGTGGAGTGGASGSGGVGAGGSGGVGGVGGSGGSGGSGGGGTHNCCTSHSTPGCTNATIQACVCAADSYCCSTKWDSSCVSEVTSEGCGSCPGGGGSGGSGGSGGGTGQVCGSVTCGSAATCCTCSGQKICISLTAGYTCSTWSSTCS